jgi:prepilin-type N-terminal cleavage/methylation domain-containing protein
VVSGPAGAGLLRPRASGGRRAFSLVEVLAAVALIGIIVFLAIPNIVQVKEDSEANLAIARAEAINLSMASYVQAQGSTAAETAWDTAADDDGRYALLASYLAFAPASFANYMPDGYTIDLAGHDTLVPLTKITLTGPGLASPPDNY